MKLVSQQQLVARSNEPQKYRLAFRSQAAPIAKRWVIWVRFNAVHLHVDLPFALSLSKRRESASRLRQSQPERLSEQHLGQIPISVSAFGEAQAHPAAVNDSERRQRR